MTAPTPGPCLCTAHYCHCVVLAQRLAEMEAERVPTPRPRPRTRTRTRTRTLKPLCPRCGARAEWSVGAGGGLLCVRGCGGLVPREEVAVEVHYG